MSVGMSIYVYIPVEHIIGSIYLFVMTVQHPFDNIAVRKCTEPLDNFTRILSIFKGSEDVF